jgi:uncharacterized membrane protein
MYVAVALALSGAVTEIDVGFTVPGDNARSMLLTLGTGVMAFVAIIYSLLFLVVQFGTTTWTPRLNIFRDHPIVYHSFGYFVGVVVFCFGTFFALADDEDASGAIPILIMGLVLVSLALFRALQTTAFRSIQLAPALSQVASRGREVIVGIYPDKFGGASSPPNWQEDAPERIIEVRWPARSQVLQVIDVPHLVDAASKANALVECVRGTGETLQEDGLVARIHGGGSDRLVKEVLKSLRGGEERTYEQDPAFAFRVLADIALRALSPAINDPATAVQSLEASEGLLRLLINRDLDVGCISDREGVTRVVLNLPSWEDYLALAIDEVMGFSENSPQVHRRIERMMKDLIEIAPPGQREPLERRLARWQSAHPGSVSHDGEKENG